MRPQNFDSQHALRGRGDPTALHNVKGHAVGVDQHCPQGLQINTSSDNQGLRLKTTRRSCLRFTFDTQTHICMTVNMGLIHVQVHSTCQQIPSAALLALDDES